MEELRLERRDDDRVIVSNSAGNEFAITADETLLAEVRSAVRSSRGVKGVNPAEIQRLIREGKTRDEVAELTGAEDADIERYEGPVLAERGFILNQAQSVPVRTDSKTEEEDLQKFGDVIVERLIGINAKHIDWSAWRDSDIGWMVALEFRSYDVDHRAVWSFDHRKRLLSPINADAVTLSKQNDPGDRLIPKLRAVDKTPEPADEIELPIIEVPDEEEPQQTHVSEEEYLRRQNIDHLAVTTTSDTPRDLGETQDLLEELRRRRGEREQQPSSSSSSNTNALFSAPGVSGGNFQDEDQRLSFAEDESEPQQPAAESARRPFDAARKADEPELFSDDAGSESVRERAEQRRSEQNSDSYGGNGHTEQTEEASRANDDGKRKKRGRAAIPSWDDILFGTRSEDDPA